MLLCVQFSFTLPALNVVSQCVVCHSIVELPHHYTLLKSFWMASQSPNDS